MTIPVLDQRPTIPAGWTMAEWEALIDALTRRDLIGGALATLLLAACGNEHPSSPAATPKTRSISTAKGSIDVPLHPQRVVCLDPGFSWQTLLEVGLTPVGIPLIVPSLVLPDNITKIKGVTTAVDGDDNPDLEKVASLKPDLILAATGSAIDKVYDRLTAIAPTAVFSFDFPSDWVTLDHAYAGAINRADQLAQVARQYKDHAAKIKTSYGTVIAKQKWALITQSSGQVYVWGSRSSAGPVLAEAGASFSAGAPDHSTPFKQLSLERLDSLADATVILYGAGSDGKPYLDTASLLNDAVFQQLPAAKTGHVYPLPSWFAYCYQDALAQLDGIAAACHELAAGTS